jgi:hypothetical protein
MPPVKAAWCCQHVCGFRYADDMLPAGSTGSMRVLIVEGEPSAHRAHRPHPLAPRSADRGSYPPGSCVPRLPCDGCRRSAPVPRRAHRPRSRRSTPQPRPGTGAVGWHRSPRMLGTRASSNAERLNVSASTWRSYVAPARQPQRTHASTWSRAGQAPPGPGRAAGSTSRASRSSPVSAVSQERCARLATAQ